MIVGSVMLRLPADALALAVPWRCSAGIVHLVWKPPELFKIDSLTFGNAQMLSLGHCSSPLICWAHKAETRNGEE